MSSVKEVKIYECNNCGKKSKWTKSWRSKLIMHKRWDEWLVACSVDCANAMDKKTKKRK